MSVRDVVIVGAGPAGLAAAIAATKSGLDYEVLEKGLLVNSIFHYPRDMVFFTTAELLEIGGLPFTTPYEKPTRAEALRYYRRVTESYDLRVSLEESVLSVRPARDGDGEGPCFEVESRPKEGGKIIRRSRCVVLAVGYYDHPNLLGIPGEDLPHVSHYFTESHGCFRQRVVVVGGRNSAAEAALELHRTGARVTLVHRHAQLGESVKYWLRPNLENRIREGSIAARFNTRAVAIEYGFVTVESSSGQERIPADAVFLLTGYHPDPGLLRSCGVEVNEQSYVPAHDPATLETNVPGIYLAGAVVSGKETNRIFIENGRFHGERAIGRIRERLSATAG